MKKKIAITPIIKIKVVAETAVTASFVITLFPILKASFDFHVPFFISTSYPSQLTTISSVGGSFESSKSSNSSSSWLSSISPGSGLGLTGIMDTSGLACIFNV